MKLKKSDIRGQIAGFLAGCRICAARQRGALPQGSHFRIISGSNFGRTGVVVKEADRYQIEPYEFLAQMDDEPKLQQRRILYEIELVEPLSAAKNPNWTPAISLKDFATFHAKIIALCDSSNVNGMWLTDYDSLAVLTCEIWDNRISISGMELWRVLAAHGMPRSAKQDCEDFYPFGLKCLVIARGRKPIKKKRTDP
jgi:hypothetical protein